MLKQLLGDRAAVLGALTRAAQGAAGLVTALFIVRYFSPVVQGYYYTFGTLLALQIFLELGLSGVITTFAAHEWAKLSLDGSGAVWGDVNALARLRSLSRKVAKWYIAGGLLLLLLLILAGGWFFRSQGGHEEVAWEAPWIAMCIVASASFMLGPAWALLTGCGQLASLNAFKLAESIVRYGTLWSCIALGASLWSAVFALFISTIGAGLFLFVGYRRFFASLLAPDPAGGFRWLEELAPLQLRIAVSWISGYFAFSVFVPAMFHFRGAEDAGRMGMTWALVAGLSGIAGSWLQAQAPRFSMMVANKDFASLDRAAWRMTLAGTALLLAGGCLGLGALLVLGELRPDLAARLLPVGSILVFLIAEFLQQISMVQSTYLRAFKREPFLGLSVATGAIIAVGTVLLTPVLGAYGPAASYLVGVVVAVVWGTLTFVRYRKQWTSQVTG